MNGILWSDWVTVRNLKWKERLFGLSDEEMQK